MKDERSGDRLKYHLSSSEAPMNKEFDDQWCKMTDEGSFFRQEVIVFILLLFVYLYTGSVRCLNHSVHSVESLSEHSG